MWGDTLECNVGTTDKKFNGKLVRSVYLKPGTARKVWVYPKENILARNIELSGDESLRGMQGVRIETINTDGTQSRFPCKVKNTTNRPIRLAADTTIVKIRIMADPHIGIVGAHQTLAHARVN